MSNSSSPSSFFDGKFLLTMVLVLGCWVGWQGYMTKKYPEHYKNKIAAEKGAVKPGSEEVSDVAGTTTAKNINSDGATAPEYSGDKLANNPEQIVTYKDGTWSFDISSTGMAIKNVKLEKYTDRTGHPVSFSSTKDTSLFGTSIIGRRQPIEFAITKHSEGEIVGVAQVDGMKITKIYHVDSNNYTIATKVRAENLSDAFTGFTTSFSESIVENEGGFFLMPQFEHQEIFAHHEGTSSRSVVTHDKPTVESYPQTKIAAFGSQYFALALFDRSPIMPEFKASTITGDSARVIATLTHNMLNKSSQFALDYVAFAGPKSFDILKTIDSDMTGLVNLGFFTAIAKMILWLMNTIYTLLGNWGVAIIILTIFVRILVLPFNMIGYKQMKAMAKIQPQMKILKEKYKGEPQKLNQEMLVLMKEAKANPLGGCLPMFLQIPIFFALYQVIGQSIDLYQAPFMFWINDLSLKDPFYVLPVLMGITMYIQQKITPNTMEPAQQKIMQFLPIFFTFLMVTLPSGLTLYIFISSVFGVLQQMFFMRDNNPVTAKA